MISSTLLAVFFSGLVASAQTPAAAPTTAPPALPADYLNGYPDAVKICEGHSLTSRKQECLTAIFNKKFVKPVVAICAEHSLLSRAQECLENVGNKFFPQEAVRICSEHSLTSRKVECVGGFAQPWPAENTLDIPRAVEHLKQAKERIRQNRQLDAADLIDLVIKDLEALKGR